MTFIDPRPFPATSIYEAAKHYRKQVRAPWETTTSASKRSFNVWDVDGVYLSNFSTYEDAEMAALAPTLAEALVALIEALDESLEKALVITERIKSSPRQYGIALGDRP